MKKLLSIILFLSLIVGLVYGAVTTTTNLSLVKPGSEDTTVNFFDTFNDNMDLIDAAFDNPLAYSDDTITKSNFADEDWGDVSVSSNVVTIDEDVIDKANFVNEDWGDMSVSGNVVTLDAEIPFSNIVKCADYDHPDDAITAIGASNKTLLVTEAETCDANFTVPSNVTVKFERGGKWTINNGITVTFNGQIDAGLFQIFAYTGTGTLAGTPVVPRVYPQWWGALGDGSNDDTTAIQNAIDFAADVTKVCLSGEKNTTYLISDTLKIPSYSYIYGKATIKLEAAADVNMMENIDRSGGNTNITLADFTLDGDGANQSATSNGVAFRYGGYINILRLRVIDTRDVMLQVHGCPNGRIIDCELLTNHNSAGSPDGISISSWGAAKNTDNWIVKNNYIYDTLDNAIVFVNVGNGVIEGNIIDDVEFVASAGIELLGGENIQIIDNIIKVLSSHGIKLTQTSESHHYYLSDILIANNHIIQSNQNNEAIYLNAYNGLLTRINLSDNIIKGGDSSIEVGMEDSIIANNILYDFSTTGIEITKTNANIISKRNIITNNHLVGDSATYSIRELYGNYNYIIGNYIRSCTNDIIIAGDDSFGERYHRESTAVPDAGTWKKGSITWNSTPSTDSVLGWICTTTGTLGTLSATTGDTVTGKSILTDLSQLTGLDLGDYLDVAGAYASKYITSLIAAVASTTVDASSASGQKILNVTATTNFVAGETIIIDRATQAEVRVIASVQSGVSLTLTEDLTNTYTNEAVENCVVMSANASGTVNDAAVTYHNAVWQAMAELGLELDDTAGNGDADKLWSADKIYDQLALKITDTADVITASLLKDDNTPADEDLFGYEATGTTGHWWSRDEVGIKFSKFDATSAPTVNNDVDEGYVVGSNWYDVTADNAYGCLDNTDGAAVWSQFIPTGGGGGWVDISGTPADNDFAKFIDADTIEGRSYSETRQDLSNYTVYPQDYGAGAGTSGDPWDGSCIESAYTACPTGGTIYMREGYYQLNGNLTLAKAINIIGEGIGKTIVRTANAIGFTINADYVTIENLTIDGDAQTDGTAYLACIEFDPGLQSYCLVRDVEVKNAGYYGIDNFEHNRCIFKNIYAHDNWRHGMHPATNTTGRNKWNVYRDIYAWNNGVAGFSDRGSNSTTGNIEATFNVYDNINCWDNADGLTLNAIIIGCQKNITVSNIHSDSNSGIGMRLSYLEDSSFINCTFTNNSTYGINLLHTKNLNFTNIIVRNNNSANEGSTSGVRIDQSSNLRFTSCQFTDDRSLVGIDIAFVDGGVGEDTITQTSARFLTAGLVAGHNVTISGSTSNDGTYAIVSVVAGTINVATASLTAEVAGDSVTVTLAKLQDYAIKTNVSADYIEFINCDLRGNLLGRIYNTVSTTISGVDTHALIEDHDYSGKWETGMAGEALAFGDLCYFNWTDKEWKLSDADAAATMPGLRIALGTAADGAECLMLIEGDIRDDSAFAFAGSMVYASCTPGDITSTAPSASGDQIQRVGCAESADILFFSPSIDVGEI